MYSASERLFEEALAGIDQEHWKYSDLSDNFQCPICNQEIQGSVISKNWSYCPFCGSKVRLS